MPQNFARQHHLRVPSPVVPSTRAISRKRLRGKTDRVVIIGAGLAGLSAALRLRAAGREAVVIEGSDGVGGRCRTETLTSSHGRFDADTGATVLTMPGLVESALTAVGVNIHSTDPFANLVRRPGGAERGAAEAGGSEAPGAWSLRRLSPAYRGEFASGRHIEIVSDEDAMCAEIARFARSKGMDGASSAELVEGYRTHRAWSQEMFSASFEHFMAADFDGVADLLSTPASASDLGHLASIGAFGRLGKITRSHLPDDELSRMFTFQALYAGAAPEKALAVYSVISHMDTTMGVYYPRHSIGEVPEFMAAAVEASGSTVLCGDPVSTLDISEDRIEGVRTASGRHFPADVVIATPDLPVVSGLLQRSGRAAALSARGLARKAWRKLAPLRWSPSAVVLHGSIPVDTARSWASQRHHTISFGHAWAETFREITGERPGGGALMSDPSLLITRPAVSAPSRRFRGTDGRLYEPLSILAPAPNLHTARIDWGSLSERYAAELLATLEARGYAGLSSDFALARLDTPATWKSAWGYGAGTPFSLAHTFTQTGPFRPRNAHAFGIDNLLLAGSSTTPGVGVPTVLLSGALAARRITGGGVR